jgi:hypothetical protein
MASRRKKAGVAVIFGLGIITIIVSIGRFVTTTFVANDISICASPSRIKRIISSNKFFRYLGHSRDLHLSHSRSPHSPPTTPPTDQQHNVIKRHN